VQFRYTIIAEEAVVAGNQMMARWTMCTLNATSLGARREVSKRGMLCVRFNSAHKIMGIELMFDVMAFMLQLKQSAGTNAFAVVPNTVHTCKGPFGIPMVMTLADRPYTIVQVNRLWEDMTSWRAEDVVGKLSCKILQGEQTIRQDVETLMCNVRYKRPSRATLINYTRGGERVFKNFINVYPLSTDSKITHYVGLTIHVHYLDVKSTAGNQNSSQDDTRKNCEKKAQICSVTKLAQAFYRCSRHGIYQQMHVATPGQRWHAIHFLLTFFTFLSKQVAHVLRLCRQHTYSCACLP